MAWHPRNPCLAVAIFNDFDFKQIVDVYAGDGAWAVANLQNLLPKPHISVTMGDHHSTV